MQRFLTCREAAKLTSLSVVTLRQMRRAGQGAPFLQFNRHTVRYPESELLKWMRSRLTVPTGD